MPQLTHMEKTAIRDSRQALADVLKSIDALDAFMDKTPDQIDALIGAIVSAYRASMLRQSNAGEIPV